MSVIGTEPRLVTNSIISSLPSRTSIILLSISVSRLFTPLVCRIRKESFLPQRCTIHVLLLWFCKCFWIIYVRLSVTTRFSQLILVIVELSGVAHQHTHPQTCCHFYMQIHEHVPPSLCFHPSVSRRPLPRNDLMRNAYRVASCIHTRPISYRVSAFHDSLGFLGKFYNIFPRPACVSRRTCVFANRKCEVPEMNPLVFMII